MNGVAEFRSLGVWEFQGDAVADTPKLLWRRRDGNPRMTGEQDKQNARRSKLKLYRPVTGSTVEVYEMSVEAVAQYASTRPAKANEIRDLIEELLAHLPEDEQQTFKRRIKTEGMI